MKNVRITIIFLALLCCSLVLTSCKDTKKEKATAEAVKVKAAAKAEAAKVEATAETEEAKAEAAKVKTAAEAKAAAEKLKP